VKRERLAASGVISLVGSAFAALGALALTVLVGNGIGAHGTGVFFQAIGVATVLIQALKLGTNSSIVRSIAEQRALGARGESWRVAVIAVVPVLVVSALVALAVALGADALATVLGGGRDTGELAGMLRLLAPYVVIASAMGALQTFARMVRGVLAFTLLQNVLLPAARLVAVAVAIAIGLGSMGAVAAWVAPLPLALVVTLIVVIGPFVRDWRDRRAARTPAGVAAAEFWRFSAARGGGAALETLFEWIDVLLVGALASPAAAGIYAVVTRTVRAGQIVDRAMRISVSPRISELLARGEVAATRVLHTDVTRLLILATWPFYLLLATLGPAVLAVYGAEFVSGWPLLAVMAVTMMIATAAGMLQSILIQGGHASWQLGNKAVAVGLLVVVNVLLLPVLGLPGAAIAWSCSLLADIALAAWQVHRRMGVRLDPARLLLSAAVPLLVFGGGGLLARLVVGESPLAVVVAAFVLCLLYLVPVWLLRRRLGVERVLRSFGRRRAPAPAASAAEIAQDAAGGSAESSQSLGSR